MCRSTLFGLAVVAGVLALLGTASTASAGSFNYNWEFEQGVDWGTNGQASQWNLVGAASWANDSGEGINKRLRLTDNNTWRNGSAWLNSTQIAMGQDWSASMRCQLSYAGGIAPADGMGMVFQTNGLGANSSAPGAYYSSFTGPSLAIDVTTYDAMEHRDALRVFVNGTLINDLSADWSLGTGVEASVYYNLFASYTAATHQLVVRFQGDHSDTGNNDHFTVDLGALFGNDLATFGYTAATGAGTDNHDVMDGSLAGSTPEPATMSLLGLGLVGLLARRRKKIAGQDRLAGDLNRLSDI